jgi:NitT/TauT family transport system substrate-binding protein
MIRRLIATIPVIGLLLTPALSGASAQERVTVGTQRLATSGALFMAATNGYFKAEGLDIEMTAYTSPQLVVEALAGGSTDFAVAAFTGVAFNLAGKGAIKAIAAQVREKRDYEGNGLIASNAAFAKGLQKPGDLAERSIAIGELGSTYHYQFSQIGRLRKFDPASVLLKSGSSLDVMARQVATGEADATILPAPYARELLSANQARFIAWVSEIDEPQLGALFVSAKTLAKRETVEKFLRAYRKGAADYAGALMRNDKYSKHVTDAKSKAAAAAIARYVYPNRADGAARVEAGVYYMDPQARLDAADLERQIEWYKSQGLIDSTVRVGNVMDLSFK